MPAPLLFLPGNGSLDGRDRTGVITASASGALRYATGQNGQQAFFIEEGTTNLATNPRFSTNASGWIVSQLATVISRDATFGHAFGESLKNVCDGSATAQGAMTPAGQIPAVQGETFTYSCWVYAPIAIAVVASVQERDGAGAAISTVNSGNLNILANQWTRVSVQTTIASASCASIRCGLWTASPQAVTYWTTEHQVEKKAYATSYCDGSLGTGYAWTGTAHASTSTRAESYLTIPNTNHIDPIQGTIAARFSRVEDSGLDTALVNVGTSSSDRILFYVGAASDQLRGYTRNMSTAADVAVRSPSIPTNQWNTAFIDWSATNVRVSLNTESTNDVARAGGYSGSFGANPIIIGASALGPSSPLDGLIQDIMIFDRPLTAGERSKLANTPVWSWGILNQIGGLLRVGSPDPIGIMRTVGDL